MEPDTRRTGAVAAGAEDKERKAAALLFAGDRGKKLLEE
jgi:hypothetical protein